MTTMLSSESILFRTFGKGLSKGLLVAIALGVGTFAVTAALLPARTFRAHALVAVADFDSPLAGTLARAAAEASVSEPVTRRAVASLIGTNLMRPAPTAFDRIAQMLGLSKRLDVDAADGNARLAADLARMVRPTPGDISGSLEISAQDSDPERAARVASAIADSLIADHDEMIARARERRAFDSATDLGQLKSALASARKRLAGLGADADASDLRAAVQQTAAAQARADSIHAVIASGSPPLSDRPSPSSAIEALQSTYLNLSQQLEAARETLGDRHVTIISLRAGMRQAAANLTAEWKRAARLADADLATARRREAMLRKSDVVTDIAQHDAVEAARRDVQVAETMVARAKAAPADASNEAQSYWLMSAPTVPKTANGLSGALRVFIAGIAGLLVAEIVLAWPMLRAVLVTWPRLLRIRHVTEVTAADWADTGARAVANAENDAATSPSRREPAAPENPFGAEKDDISIPSLMVATHDSPADTTLVALAIGRAAVDAGLRVLIVEPPRPRPTLAIAVHPDAAPEVVGLRGNLHVILRADGTAGDLRLAPSFVDGVQLASTLVRGDEATLIDDVNAAFDLLVIDGGCVTEDLVAAWSADSYVRVGKSQSQRDDVNFADAFGVPVSALLETVVTTTLAVDGTRRPVRPRSSRVSPDARWASASQAGVFLTSSHAPFARPVVARRTSGARPSLYERR